MYVPLLSQSTNIYMQSFFAWYRFFLQSVVNPTNCFSLFFTRASTNTLISSSLYGYSFKYYSHVPCTRSRSCFCCCLIEFALPLSFIGRKVCFNVPLCTTKRANLSLSHLIEPRKKRALSRPNIHI